MPIFDEALGARRLQAANSLRPWENDPIVTPEEAASQNEPWLSAPLATEQDLISSRQQQATRWLADRAKQSAFGSSFKLHQQDGFASIPESKTGHASAVSGFAKEFPDVDRSYADQQFSKLQKMYRLAAALNGDFRMEPDKKPDTPSTSTGKPAGFLESVGIGVKALQGIGDAKKGLKKKSAYQEDRTSLSGTGEIATDTFKKELFAMPPEDRERFIGVFADYMQQRKPPEERSFGGKFGERLMRGKHGVVKNLAGTVAHLNADGNPDLSDNMAFLGQVDAVRKGLDQATSENWIARGLLGAAEMTPALATSAGLSMIPGGAATVPSFWYTQTYPGLYQELRAEGINEDVANGTAMIGAIPIALVETIQFGRLQPQLKEEAKAIAAGSMKKYLIGRAKEGGITWAKEMREEAIQGALEVGTKAAAHYLDDKAPGMDWAAEFDSQLEQLGEAALALPFLMAPGQVVDTASGALALRRDQQAQQQAAPQGQPQPAPDPTTPPPGTGAPPPEASVPPPGAEPAPAPQQPQQQPEQAPAPLPEFAPTPEYAAAWTEQNMDAATALAKKVAAGGKISRKDFESAGLPSGSSVADRDAFGKLLVQAVTQRLAQQAQPQPQQQPAPPPTATEQPPPPPSTTEIVPPTNPDVRKPQLPAPAEVAKAFEDQYGENGKDGQKQPQADEGISPPTNKIEFETQLSVLSKATDGTGGQFTLRNAGPGKGWIVSVVRDGIRTELGGDPRGGGFSREEAIQQASREASFQQAAEETPPEATVHAPPATESPTPAKSINDVSADDLEAEILGELTGKTAQPGSQAKIDLMRARVERGEPIFQEGDAGVGTEAVSPPPPALKKGLKKKPKLPALGSKGFGHAGSAVVRSIAVRDGFDVSDPSDTDAQDLLAFAGRFYRAGFANETMPAADMHPDEAHRFYRAGQIDGGHVEPKKKGLKKKPQAQDQQQQKPPESAPPLGPIVIKPIFGGPETKLDTSSVSPSPASAAPAAEPSPGDKALAEANEAAKKLAELFKTKLFTTGTDPELMVAAAKMTALYVKAGVIKFREFIAKVRAVMGDEVTKKGAGHLRKAWDFVRNKYPDAGMDESIDVEEALGVGDEQSAKSQEPAASPAPQPPPSEETADATLSKRVAEWLQDNNGPLSAAEFFAMADEAYGGTRAEGTYGPSDAYDALESGVNQFLQDFTTPQVDAVNAKEEAAALVNLVRRLPSQTNRSGEKVELQQFSTPPSYAYVAAWLANLKPRDVVLEPSAGVGGIAVHARNAGATVFVNDISKRRANLLQQLDVDKVFTEDAEQIANILPSKMPAPTVVVMNPPFSKAGTRMGLKKMIGTDLKHIDQALKLLAPNGRLVAIIGAPLHYEDKGDTQTFKNWYSERSKDYNIRANVMVGRDVYKGYGTTFPTRVLVIDKTGSTVTGETVTGDAATLSDLITKLNEVRNDRATSAQQQPPQPAGEKDSPRTKGGGERGPSIQPPTGDRGPASGEDGGVDGGLPAGGAGTSGVDAGVETGDGAKPDAGVDAGGKRRPKGGGGGSRGGKSGDRPVGESSAEDATPEPADTADRLTIENQAPESKSGELTDNLFEAYHPSKLKIPGAKPHPGSIVESAAMASVSSPDAKYSPAIPRDVIEKGLLSEVQLEPIVYGGQAHEEFLAPDKQGVSHRKGYMVGDGTGVGKGRIIAGFILDNFGQGRKKAIWVSKNTGLLGSAKRDWKGIGQNPDLIMDFGKTELGAEIKPKSGVMFVTYGQVKMQGKGDKAGQSRLQQLVDWLGEDFDGVIAFDEAHMMSGAAPSSGSRGAVAPSMQGLAGLALQRALPKARIVYVTATAATEVNHLAYAERLGLWGAGTEFPGGMSDFVAKIKDGGVAAMELVTLSLKALGKYLARSLSFNDGTPEGTVEFDRLEHTLTPEQRQVYDRLAEAWQVTLNNFNAAIGMTGANNRAKSAAMSQFWGSHQRFFNQVITSMQLPSVIAGIEKDIADGKSVVIQLTNTGEAQQERSLAGRQDGDDLSDFDTSPADVLINMVENSYPTQQYEDYIDENGNPSSRPVVDSNGNPVHNADALAAKAQLLEDLASIQVPNSPIDGIIDHFGHEMVAEVTGRSRRIILMENDKGQRVKTENKRSKGFSSSAEISSFQDGKKQILIFSEAGGTGESFHADRAAKNQSKRKHYLLQAGWKAAAAVQGLGRTHRTNQAQAPEYVLVHTDLKGQKRFLSTIARRLSQLGALTKGQRQTGSQGMFSARDNLEGTEAKDALHNFFRDLLGGNIEAISVQDFEQQTGLKLRGPDGAPLQQLPTIRSFLNRLLSLRVDMQNAVFDEFDQRLSEQVRQAEADGTLDAGVENLVADRIEKVSETVAFTDPASGAEVKYVKLRRYDKTEPLSFEQEEVNGPIHYVRNNKTGNVFAVETSEATRTDPRTGAVHRQHRLRNQAGKTSTVDEEKIRKEDGYTKLYGSEARQAWNEAMKKLPEFQSADVHMLTGALLLVWNRLRGHTQVKRTVTDKGEQLLGRIIPSLQVAATLRDLGIQQEGGDARPNLTPQQAVDAVLDDGAKLILSNDWKIKKSSVQGEDRIEIVGPNFTSHAELDRAGAFRETIASKVRYFIPVGENAANVLAAITASRPIIRVEGGTGNYDVHSAGMPNTPAPKKGLKSKRNASNGATSPAPPATTSTTAPFAASPQETVRGKRLMRRLKSDANQAGTKRVGLRSIVEYLNDTLGVLMLVGKTQTSRKHPAHYQRSSHIVRSKAGYWQINIHEAGHAISAILDEKMPRWRQGLGEKLKKLTQAKGSMASANSIEEGVAEFARRYVVDYGSIPADLTQSMESSINAADPKILQALRDAHRAYQFHRSRPVADQMQTIQNDKKPQGSFAARTRDAMSSLLFNIVGGSVVIQRLIRRAHLGIGGDTGFTAYDPTGITGLAKEAIDQQYRHAQRLAREVLKGVEDTPADIESAYQSTLRIPSEIGRAIGGVRSGREGVRIISTGPGFGNLSDDTVKALRDLGLNIPEATRHGEWIYLGDKSFARIKHDVGLDKWESFVTYGQYRAAVERYGKNGQRYPGLMDGLTPSVVQSEIARLDKENPSWDGHFKAVNNYMDQLLLVTYLSGELSLDELARIKAAYSDYWPLQREVEDRNSMFSGAGAEPGSGIRRAFGSDLPFRSLDEAVEVRTKMAIEAYYTNRLMLALRDFGKAIGTNKNVPFNVRKENMRIMLPLRMEKYKAATLSPHEEAEVVADAINRRTLEEAGVSSRGMSSRELREAVEDAVGDSAVANPEDVIVSRPSKSLWRLRKPNALHVVAPWEGGERQYYQLTDPLLFDLFTASKNPGRYIGFIGKLLGGMVAPWKRAITQNLVFAVNNSLSRDPATAMFTGKGAESLMPYLYAGVAAINRLKGTNLDAISESELLSRTLDVTSKDAHRGIVGSFFDMLKEGVSVPNWREFSLLDKFAMLPGQTMSAVLKPVDVINWATGGRALSAIGEELTREGAYLRESQRGASHERSQLQYESITGNFGQKPGNAGLAALVRTAGFLNPAIQIGWGQVSKATHPDPHVRALYVAGKLPAIAMWGAVGAAINYLMILGMHGDDDEQKEVLDNMRERLDRDRMAYMPIAGKLRLPFDHGPVGGVFSYGWNSVEGWLLDDPVHAEEKAKGFLSRFLEVPGLADAVNPQLKVAIETGFKDTGYSFFYDKEIVPGFLVEKYPYNPELRSMPDTPDVYDSAAGALKSATGIKASPMKLQYAVQNAFARQYDELAVAFDKYSKGRPFELADIPLIGRLALRESRGFSSQSVRSLVSLDAEYKGLKAAIEEGIKTRPNDPELKAMSKRMLELAGSHKAMLEIGRLWDEAKAAKIEPGKAGSAADIERNMTKRAELFFENQEKETVAGKKEAMKGLRADRILPPVERGEKSLKSFKSQQKNRNDKVAEAKFILDAQD